MVEAKTAADRAEREAKNLRAHHKRLEADLWERFQREKNKTQTFEGLIGDANVQLQRRETIRARVFDPEAAERSLRERGYGDSILAPTHAIRQKPLNELVRDILKNGGELPDGVDYSATRFFTVQKREA